MAAVNAEGTGVLLTVQVEIVIAEDDIDVFSVLVLDIQVCQRRAVRDEL